jgi:hypothetical protein
MNEMTVVERIRARAYELWQQDTDLRNGSKRRRPALIRRVPPDRHWPTLLR